MTKVPLMVAPVPDAAMPVTFTVLFLVQPNETPGTPLGFEIAMAENAVPPQTVCVRGTADTSGAGLTVMVNVLVDEHPLASAVSVKVVVCNEAVVLVSVPEILVPLPEAGIPVRLAVLSRVQLKVVPATVFDVPKFTVVTAELEHTLCDAGAAVGNGIGSTTTLAVTASEMQPSSEVAIIVNTVVCCEPVVLVKVPVILPVPDAGIPVRFPVLSRVQLYVTTPGIALGLFMAMVAMAVPEHNVCEAGIPAAVGLGLTDTLIINVVPKQLPEVAVTV